jgi:hypothetical protein
VPAKELADWRDYRDDYGELVKQDSATLGKLSQQHDAETWIDKAEDWVKERFAGPDPAVAHAQASLEEHLKKMLRAGEIVDLTEAGRPVPWRYYDDKAFAQEGVDIDVESHMDLWSNSKKVEGFVEQFKGKVDKGAAAAGRVEQVSEVFGILYGDKGIGGLAKGIGSIAGKVEKMLGKVGGWASKITKPVNTVKDVKDIGTKVLEGAYSGRGSATEEQLDHFYDGSEAGEYERERFKNSSGYVRFGRGAGALSDEASKTFLDKADPYHWFHDAPPDPKPPDEPAE